MTASLVTPEASRKSGRDFLVASYHLLDPRAGGKKRKSHMEWLLTKQGMNKCHTMKMTLLVSPCENVVPPRRSQRLIKK